MTVVPTVTVEQLATDLIKFNEWLDSGNEFIFRLGDVQRIHVPWHLPNSE